MPMVEGGLEFVRKCSPSPPHVHSRWDEKYKENEMLLLEPWDTSLIVTSSFGTKTGQHDDTCLLQRHTLVVVQSQRLRLTWV